MSGRIRGAFPGGPSHTELGAPAATPPHLARVAELEAAVARRRRARTAKGRRRRVTVGVLATLAASLGLGIALGRASHASAAQLHAEAERRMADDLVSAQVNRVLLELWKMEDVEAARGRVVPR